MYGKIIRTLRKEQNLTQADLSKMLNFKSASAVGMIEREERELNLDTLYKLSEIFNVSVDYILGKTSEKLSDKNNEFDDIYETLTSSIKPKLEKMSKDKRKKIIKEMLNILNNN